MDIGLQSMNGYALVRKMKAQPGGEATRFVAVTGYGQASDTAKAMDAGFVEHVVKPVSLDRLHRLIDELDVGP